MSRPASPLPQRDLVDVRLVAAIDTGGCVLCAVRTRSEAAEIDSILAERVQDLGFRAGLEVDQAFCRRHVRALLATDRQTSGILSSSILFRSILDRRLERLRHALAARGRTRRRRLEVFAQRPTCPACGQGAAAVEVAMARLVHRSADPAWAAVIGEIPFCLDDLGQLIGVAADSAPFRPVVERQLARLGELAARLEGYAHNSAQDRRQLLTDEQRTAADDASRLLGGD
jgi:hypothetical protein